VLTLFECLLFCPTLGSMRFVGKVFPMPRMHSTRGTKKRKIGGLGPIALGGACNFWVSGGLVKKKTLRKSATTTTNGARKMSRSMVYAGKQQKSPGQQRLKLGVCTGKLVLRR